MKVFVLNVAASIVGGIILTIGLRQLPEVHMGMVWQKYWARIGVDPEGGLEIDERWLELPDGVAPHVEEAGAAGPAQILARYYGL